MFRLSRDGGFVFFGNFRRLVKVCECILRSEPERQNHLTTGEPAFSRQVVFATGFFRGRQTIVAHSISHLMLFDVNESREIGQS